MCCYTVCLAIIHRGVFKTNRSLSNKLWQFTESKKSLSLFCLFLAATYIQICTCHRNRKNLVPFFCGLEAERCVPIERFTCQKVSTFRRVYRPKRVERSFSSGGYTGREISTFYRIHKPKEIVTFVRFTGRNISTTLRIDRSLTLEKLHRSKDPLHSGKFIGRKISTSWRNLYPLEDSQG